MGIFFFFFGFFLERSLACFLGGYGILWMVKMEVEGYFQIHIQYISIGRGWVLGKKGHHENE